MPACRGEPPKAAKPKRPAQEEYETLKKNLCWQFRQICGSLALELQPDSEARQALDRVVAEFRARYPDVPPEAQ